MYLDVITPNKKIVSEEIEEVILQTPNGEIGILPNHQNYVSQITPGALTVKSKGKTRHYALAGGFVEVNNNKVTILSDYAVYSEEINVEKAMAAKQRAEELLKKKDEGMTQQEYALATSELQRAVLELHVSNKLKKQRRIPQN